VIELEVGKRRDGRDLLSSEFRRHGQMLTC